MLNQDGAHDMLDSLLELHTTPFERLTTPFVDPLQSSRREHLLQAKVEELRDANLGLKVRTGVYSIESVHCPSHVSSALLL
jgi:hypothetical protein